MRDCSLGLNLGEENNKKLNERRGQEGAGGTKTTLKEDAKSCQPFYVKLMPYWNLYRPAKT